MKDEPSLRSLEERLERLDSPIRIWREARDRAFAAAFGPKEGKLSNLMGRLPQASGAAASVGLGPRDEVFAAFDETCDLYARSDAARCALIRGIVHNREARVLVSDDVGYAARILKQGARREGRSPGSVAVATAGARVDCEALL